jgi:hypothetical protein
MAGYWWASIPPEEWPQDAESLAEIQKYWDKQDGDARQEIVLIGMYMDQQQLTAEFDACLLNDDEMALGPHAWQSFNNPFEGRSV